MEAPKDFRATQFGPMMEEFRRVVDGIETAYMAGDKYEAWTGCLVLHRALLPMILGMCRELPPEDMLKAMIEGRI